MTPLLLTLTAFGPYREPQTLDWRPLQPHGIFLIHGPTGAGKSYLLDALCFALFGEASTAERPDRSLRCDLADPKDNTEVDLVFAWHGEHYRIKRSPRYPVPGNKRDRQPRATIWRLSPEALPALALRQEPKTGLQTVIAGRPTDATNAMQELLGVTADEFRQVVVLPQGRFRDFLLAKTPERQKILQTLFDTDFFRRVEHAFKERVDAATKAVEGLRADRTATLRAASVADPEALQTKRESLAAQTETHRQSHETLAIALEAARQQEDSARELQAKFKALTDARNAQEALTEQAPTIAALKEKRAIAQQAERLAPEVRRADELRKDAQTKEQEWLAAQKTQAQAKAAAAAAQTTFAKAEARKPELNALTESLRELRRWQDLTQGLAALRQATIDLQKRLATATKEVQTVRTKQLSTQTDIAGTTAQQESLQSQAQRVPQLTVDVKHAAEARQLEADVEETQDHQDALTAALAEKETQIAALDEHLAEAETYVESLRHTLEQAQAASLAHGLEPGQPCPVCGSETHPQLATPPDGTATRAAVTKAEKTAKELERRKGGIEKDQATLTAQRDATITRLTELRKRLQALPMPEDTVSREAHLEALERELVQAQQAADELQAIRKRLAAMKTAQTALQQTLAVAQETERELERQFERANTAYQQRLEDIPSDYHDAKVLAATIAERSAAHQALQTELQDTDDRKEKALRTLTDADARLELMQQASTKASADAQAAEKALAEALREKGFADRFVHAAALQSPSVLATWDAQIQAHADETTRVTERVRLAQEAVAGKEPPELAPLTAQHAAAKSAFEASQQQLSAWEHEAKMLAHTAARLASLDAELATSEANTADLAQAARIIRGQGEGRLSFEAWVQATLLEQVLTEASVRLKTMSEGRFTLTRSKDADTPGRRPLDLNVFDEYTGTERPAASLSGGESFLASLALALGLSDVVRQFAGGIHLDTLLVDEGFGSLDTDALDRALQTLEGLRAGNRLVGVISHVPELATRIPAKIHVHRTRQGSQLQVVV